MIVMCHGVFDVFHWGHLQHLKSAKKFGNYLIVSVTSDRFVDKGDGRPVFNQDQRMEMIKALRFVDKVVLSDHPTPKQSLIQNKPDIYVKGYDYAGKGIPEAEYLKKNGIRLEFTPEVKIHTSNLIR